MSLDRRALRPRALLAAVVLAAPIAFAMTAAASVATAAPAQAGTIAISDGKVTSRSEHVTVSVKVPALYQGALGIVPPGSSDATKVDSGNGGQTLSYTFRPKRNGIWKAVYGQSLLGAGNLLGLLKSPDKTRSIVVAAAPAKPSGLAAAASSRTVAVRWNKGGEPDLTSYRVSAGGATKHLAVGSACGASTCTASLPAPAGGGRTTVTVTANRSAPGGSLSSTPASRSVRVPAGHGAGSGTAGRSTGAGGGGYGGFPTPDLGGGGGGRYAGLVPGGYPGPDLETGQSAAPDPYPSFGLRPSVAPLASSDKDNAVHPLVEPLAAGSSAGATAVPVALGLVFVLVMAHIWLWTRSGRRLRPVLASGAHRVSRRFHRDA
jgi:hypothetical protein